MLNLLAYSQMVLRTTPQQWIHMAETLPAELLVTPPAEGVWPALSCLKHLMDTERWVFQVRVGCFLRGEDFPAFNPDEQGTVHELDEDPRRLAEEFRRLRAESLFTLAGLTPQNLERGAVHAELGPVTLGEMLHEWAAHDLNHTVQAQRAIMQPFIAGSGPWQVYFKDHVIVGHGSDG